MADDIPEDVMKIGKPDDVPGDVWRAAAVGMAYHSKRQELIARAIMAERERCAMIATGDGSATDGTARPLRSIIARAIRTGEAS